MSGFGQYSDIILFAMIAGFLVLRLRSVLGRRTGHERQRDPFARRAQARHDAVVNLPERGRTAPTPALAGAAGGPVAQALARVGAADPGFNPARFLDGVRVAFGMIVAAFAQGDKATLRRLLSDEVFAPFAAAIDERVAAGETHESHIAALKQVEIVGAAIEGREARVTTRIVSDQINVTRARDGVVVDGDPAHPVEKIDFWTFARDTRSSDPNWVLAATSSD